MLWLIKSLKETQGHDRIETRSGFELVLQILFLF